jgi:uncharacterized protein
MQTVPLMWNVECAWTGPAVVRRLPEAPLRIAIALAGFGLAWTLWRDATAS